MSLHMERGHARSPSTKIVLLVAVLTGWSAAAQTPGPTVNPTVLAPSARQALPNGGVTVESPEPGQTPPHPAHVAPNGNGGHMAPARHRRHAPHHHVKPFVEEWR